MRRDAFAYFKPGLAAITLGVGLALAFLAHPYLKGGTLLILQPNIRFLADEYWDFVDHQLPLSDRSVVEALELLGLGRTEPKGDVGLASLDHEKPRRHFGDELEDNLVISGLGAVVGVVSLEDDPTPPGPFLEGVWPAAHRLHAVAIAQLGVGPGADETRVGVGQAVAQAREWVLRREDDRIIALGADVDDGLKQHPL